MTQEVQPLAWQKRTNIEEHQQFFSKINEIIGNLAPTVDEAEQAIASANAAINTANAASANADAAAQQAQTAASTVAGYDARMTAVESKNTQQDTAISVLQTADGQNVKLTGAQDITGIKTVPTEATKVMSKQIANSLKIGAELDAYETMVRTVNAQTIGGPKEFVDNLTAIGDKGYNRKTTFDWSNTPPTNQAKAYNEITDANNVRIYVEQLYSGTDGKKDKEFILYNKAGQNIRLIMEFGSDGKGKLLFRDTKGTTHTIFQEP